MIIIFNKNTLIILAAIILIIVVLTVGSILYMQTDTFSAAVKLEELYRPIEKGNENSGFIAFACNVDWGNEVIPKMLQVLNEKNIKITFFVTGRWVQKYPHIFKTIVEEGHEIGNHGYEHLDYSKLSFEKNKEQIQKSEEVIKMYTMVKPALFAPPSGAYNKNTLLAAQSLGYKTILWTIDTIDWRQGSTKEVILQRVLNKPDHRGAIVLMHPMPETVKALPDLIGALKEKGLEVGKVSKVLED